MSDELDKIQLKEGCKPNLFLNFLMPALIIIAVTIGTYVCMGSAKTLECIYRSRCIPVHCNADPENGNGE